MNSKHILNQFTIFIINLEKDLEKRQHMQNLCDKYNLNPIFIKAIDGNLLDKAEISNIYSKKQALKDTKREMSKGEIGCALSHKKIYQKIIDENIDKALVLEDDVDFNQNLIECLSIADRFPKKWEVLLLGHHYAGGRNLPAPYNFWYKKNINTQITIRIPSQACSGTYGYCINNNGANTLLTHLRKISHTSDNYTGNSKYNNVYMVQKPLILINSELTDMSNLQSERQNIVQKYNKMQKYKSRKRKVLEFLNIYEVAKIIYIPLNQFWLKIKPPKKYKYTETL